MGLGKMGSAILSGIERSGICTKEELLLSGHSHNEALRAAGYATVDDVNELADAVSILILAIKPQAFPSALARLVKKPRALTVVSIAAGISLASLEDYFGALPRIRVMPNTPAMIGLGMSALSRSAGLTDREFAPVKAIFSALGETIEIPESLMDGVVALSGSMPAFVYLFVKDFVAAGVALGFSEKEALALVTSTIKGAIGMIETQKKSLAELIEDVSSKGGTTIAGLDALHAKGFDDAIKACAYAAAERSKELARKK